MNETLSLTIGGDIYLQSSIAIPPSVDPFVVSLFKSSDISVVNFEAPVLTANGTPIEKTGPNLIGSPAMLDLCRSLHVKAISLANNHIYDSGPIGLENTIRYLNEWGFLTVGAGNDLYQSRKPLVLSKGNLSISVLCYAENEWSTASEKRGGANPYDVIEVSRALRLASQKTDFVVLYVHGGHEYYELPSPQMQQHFRFFIESGADAVFCSHSHAISGCESHQGKPIFYGLGNLFFGLESSFACWRQGLVVKLTLAKNLPPSFEVFHTQFDTKRWNLGLTSGIEGLRRRDHFSQLSNTISCQDSIERCFLEYVSRRQEEYLSDLMPQLGGLPEFLIKTVRRIGLVPKRLNRKRILRMAARLFCESHFEMSRRAIRNLISNDAH